ncbi:hypothetical protein [Pseudomonas viridiflava]|jgi:hypothetical protein|uniref:hypothetical protein n=1 Tax=Pseudomonas viridiflava TaxID=33069 RepID=UPI002B1CE5C0|nr:hypothetical protein [Pseudomonas viridiflava]
MKRKGTASRSVGFFYNQDKKSIKAEQGRELIEHHDTKFLESFLAHQYTIRRLIISHPEQYNAILKLRTKLDAAIDKTGLSNKQRMFAGTKVCAIEQCMWFFEFKENRNPNIPIEKIREFLTRSLTSTDIPGIYYISHAFEDSHLSEISNIIADSLLDVKDFFENYNYSDYYTLFSLSNFVSGENLANHYLRTKAGHHNLKVTAELGHEELQWYRTDEAVEDDELSGITTLNCSAIKKTTSNVQIFGHDQHDVSVNGHKLSNHLVLAVPLDKAPENIDHALIMFRQALKQALIDVHGSFAAVDTPDFSNSLFMSNHEDRALLSENIKQFRSKVHGLWGWDLVNAPKSPEKKITIDTMCVNLTKLEQELKDSLTIKESCYAYESNRNHYDHASKIIGSKKTKDQTLLDKYISRGEVKIGLRNTPTVNNA